MTLDKIGQITSTWFSHLKSSIAAVAWHHAFSQCCMHFLETGTWAFPLNLSISCFVISEERCRNTFVCLKTVERGRKGPICTDPYASNAILLWHFPLDSQEGQWGQGKPRVGQPHCKSRARILIRNEGHGLCGLWNSMYISSEIKTNLKKVKTVLNLPAQIPKSASFIFSKGRFYLISLWLSKHWVSILG